ncbi:MAG: serine hydrolase [SAR324 cluster bacterium]|nr:serine hydrolase [SAR324 cluster bacterium]
MEDKTQYRIVNVEHLNMRVGPGRKHRIVKVLSRGMYLSLTHSARRGWALVKDWDGTTGWVAKKYTRQVQDKGYRVSLSKGAKFDASALEVGIQRFIQDLKRKGRMFTEDNLSLIIKDLHSDKLVASINPTAQVKAASLIKVPILQAYMIQRYRKKIVHSKSNQKHLVRMIRYSNNRSTNRILKLLGGPWKVKKILQNTGLYSHLKLVEYIPQGGRTYLNKISAEDLNRLFIRLWDRQILGQGFSSELNEKASDQMLYLLGLSSRRGVKDRLKDGTCFASDRTAKIWDKTGFVRGLNADVGIIEINTPKGRRPYSIISIIDRPNYHSIRGSGNSWARRQSKFHRMISEMSYAYFKNKYGAPTKCGKKRLNSYTNSKSLVADSI